MAPRSRLSIAKADIVKTLNALGKNVFTRSDLEELLDEHREFWRLAKDTTFNTFVRFLQDHAGLQENEFKFPRPTNRYTLGKISTLEIVQSLQPNGYFSHYTAVSLHGLTEQVPKTIFDNSEQRLKPGGGELTQGGINRAFASRCRVSNNRAEYKDQEICLLNGANTNQLGVVAIETSSREKLRVTDLERTLIDIVVRPNYSGGISEIAKAYSEAAEQISVNRLVAYLKKLGYTYPYHQSIGYYMERSNKYSESQLSLIKQLEITYDFYLDYQIREKKYIEKWRLFVPKGF